MVRVFCYLYHVFIGFPRGKREPLCSLAQVSLTTSHFQLDLIALQLFHQKIEFTANGFFTIDMTLIYAVIGAVTTYLVILLQFNNGVSLDIAEDQLTE